MNKGDRVLICDNPFNEKIELNISETIIRADERIGHAFSTVTR